ncbi:MAG: LytTR family DNA-binding domain-containing protein [Deltaproteobacteria bacterium]|nr:LytTR family DNA-binding domain-containing protein [Deltaproteobacteria bacterium]
MGSSYSSSVSDDEVDGSKEHPWEAAYREALSPYIFKRVLILMALYLGAYTLICPLGADGLTWTQRAAYLGLCSALVAPLCYAEYVVTLYLTRYWSPPGITLAAFAATFIATPTATVIAYGVDTLLFPPLLVPADWPTVYLFLTISVLICGTVTHYLVSQRSRDEAAGETWTETLPDTAPPDTPDERAASRVAAGHNAEESRSGFLRRLPAEAGQDVIYLKMRDHYVEIVTATGNCALLMRFVDAIHELSPQGIRVHRSYWVALRHVEGWTKRNHRVFLRLTGGHLVPVSRTYLAQTRAAVEREQSPQATSAKESR